jgi:hypothetical protein
MTPDLKHPATGDLIVLADGEQLWRIGWPGNPVLVVTKSGPDGSAIYRLADPKCKTWNRVGDMKLVPWPEAAAEQKGQPGQLPASAPAAPGRTVAAAASATRESSDSARSQEI